MTSAPVALTLGDPAGVGPEITAKAWAELRKTGPCFFLIGDPQLAAAHGPVSSITAAEEAAGAFARGLPVLPVPLASSARPGSPDPANAPAMIASIERAVVLALSGAASAVVTNPVSKAALYAAGFQHPGHTEFVAELVKDAPHSGPRGPVMMLAGGGLRVALVTIHLPLTEAIAALNAQRIIHAARVTHHALKTDFGVAAPRLALAGLNPHAGEGGALGREELEIITPAAETLRAEGVVIAGPLPADTLFHEEARAKYDAVTCLYHDQGLIPVKTLDFWGGVNVTLGLPVVRTSPDHGTGFDIAGKGAARPESLVAAIRMAAQIAAQRGR